LQSQDELIKLCIAVKRLIFVKHNMNKSELIATMAAKAEMPKAKAQIALDAALEAILEAVKKGENVQLIGFGTFNVVEKPERKGMNPATKQAITIPARKVVRFKAGAKMAL